MKPIKIFKVGKASSAAITTYDLNNKIEDTGNKAKVAAAEINNLSKEWQDYIKKTKSDILSNTLALSQFESLIK